MRSTTQSALVCLTLFNVIWASVTSIAAGCALPSRTHAASWLSDSIYSLPSSSRSSTTIKSVRGRSSSITLETTLPVLSSSRLSRSGTSSAGKDSCAPGISRASCGSVTTITITATSTPVETTTTYANVIRTFIDEGPTFYTFILSTSFVLLDGTTTATFAITPSNIVGVTTTYVEPTPSGFRPVQDTLKGATYVGARIIPKRQALEAHTRHVQPAKVCTSATTLMRTASPSTFTFTQTSPVSIIVLQGVSSTIVLGVDATATTTTYTTVTISGTQYASTTTRTVTAEPPIVTQYAACSSDNFADFVRVNGTLIAIDTIAERTNLDVTRKRDRFDCCSHAIQRNASVFAYLSYDANGYCAVLYPVDQPNKICRGPAAVDFRALLRNAATEVIGGNAYCGQLSSYLVDS